MFRDGDGRSDRARGPPLGTSISAYDGPGCFRWLRPRGITVIEVGRCAE
jgi:hypothetical protein